MATLFIGNRLNRIKNNYSWGQLLEDIGFYFLDVEDRILLEKSPNDKLLKDKLFPMIYEEIYLKSKRKNLKMNEEEIRHYICEKFSIINSNHFHSKIWKMGFDNIITTNYDYAIEKVKVKSWDLKNTYTNKPETKF